MADGSRTVKIEILGDAANAVKALSTMEESGNSLETSVAKNHEGIKSSGEGMESSLSKSGEGIKETGNKVSESLKSSSEAAKEFVAEVATKLIELAAAGEALNQVKEAVSTAAELGQATLNLTRETGMSAEASSALLAAMERYGITGEEASKSLGNLSKQIDGSALTAKGLQGGLTATSDRLKQMGIDVLDTTGKTRPMSDILSEVADKFHALPDGAEKTAIAMQLFGKAGKDMIPILNQGSEGLQELQDESKKLGLTLSGDNVAQIEKFRLASVSMNEAIGGVKLQLGVALMPLLTELAGYVIQASEAFNTKAIPAIKAFGSSLGTAFEDLTNGNVIGAINDLFGGVIKKVEDLASKMLGAGSNATKTFAQGIIQGAQTYVKDAVNFVSKMIANFLIGNSPPPEGPLSQIDKGGETLGKTYVAGMKTGFAGVSDVANSVSDTLTAAQEKFAANSGNLDYLKSAAQGADDAVLSLNHSINAIDEAEAPIKENIQDITNSYQDQIDPLQQQLDLLKQQVDHTNQLKELNIDLADFELQKQENATKPEAADIDKQIKDLENQSKGIGKNGTDFQAQMTAIQRQMRDLGNSTADAAKRKELQHDLDNLNDQQTAARDADQKAKDLIQQQIDALRDKKAALDDGLKAQRDALATQKETLALDDKEAALKKQIAELPLQQQIDGLKQGEKDALDPLNASIQLMDRRKSQLDEERASWGLLKQDIADAQKPLVDAAKLKANNGQGLDTGGDTPSDTQSPTVADAMKKKGEGAGKSFLKGAEDFIKQHLPESIGAGVGAAAGGIVLGPVGVLIGGALGGSIGSEVEKVLKEHGVNFSEVAKTWGEKLKDIGGNIKDSVAPALEQIGTYVKDTLIPNWKDAAKSFASDVGPALKQLGEGLAIVGKWIVETVLPALVKLMLFISAEVLPKLLELAGHVLADLVKVLGDLAKWFADHPDIMQAFGVAIGVAVIAWGAYSIAMAVATAATAAWAVVGGVAAGVMAFLTSPVTLVIAAIALLALGIFELIKHWDEITKKVPILGDAWNGMKDFVLNILLPAFKEFADFLLKVWDEVFPKIVDALGKVKDAVVIVLTAIHDFIADHTDQIEAIFSAAWNVISTVIETAVAVIRDLIKVFLDVTSGNWSGAWNDIKDIFKSVWDLIRTILGTELELIKNVLSLAWDAIKSVASDVWNAILQTIIRLAFDIRDKITQAITDAKNALFNIWDALKQDVENAWNGIKTFFENAGPNLLNALLQPFKDFKNQVGDYLSGIPVIGGIGSYVGGHIPHAASGAYVTSPTVLLSGEGHDPEGEITSPVSMMRKVIREEMGNGGNVQVTQHITGVTPEQVLIQTKKALRHAALERSV